MTLNAMIEKRKKLLNTMDGFLDTHKGVNGVLSKEDDAVYAEMEQEFKDLTTEIQRMQRREEMEREMNKPINTPITEKPMNVPSTETEEKKGRASKAYNKAFWKKTRERTGFDTLSVEMKNALQEGTDSEGGYLVPDEFENTLVQSLEEENIVRKLAHTFTTSAGDRKIPIVTTKGTAAWTGEEQAYHESDDTFGQQSIGAHKVTTLIKVSEELLNDSAFDLEGYFSTEFARRIGNKEEEAFLLGDGDNKPLGILSETGGAEIGVTTASATAITADELIDLFYSLNSAYRKNAVWLLNDSTMKVIRKLKDSSGQYLWQPALHEGGHETLLGKRIYTSPYFPEVASGNKTVAFGDFSFYWIGDRQGINFRRLNELYATTGQVGFIASKRLDGKLILPEAVKVLQQKGGTTTA